MFYDSISGDVMIDVITDEMVKKHQETYYAIRMKIMGLHVTASALESRSKILVKDGGQSSTSEALDFNAKVIHEIAGNLKTYLDELIDQENEMFAFVAEQLDELVKKRGP